MNMKNKLRRLMQVEKCVSAEASAGLCALCKSPFQYCTQGSSFDCIKSFPIVQLWCVKNCTLVLIYSNLHCLCASNNL